MSFKGNDIAELSRHIYSNSVDRASIRKLLERVFVKCKCNKNECTKHEVAFEVEDTVSTLDMKQENIQTLLCYLELNTKKLVKNLQLSYIFCKITSYKGPLFLKQLSKTVSKIFINNTIPYKMNTIFFNNLYVNNHLNIFSVRLLLLLML